MSITPKSSAIIVAAGKSHRFNNQDKLFFPLLNRPLLAWTLEVFQRSELIDEIILVLHQRNLAMGEELVRQEGFTKVSRLCLGGERRQDSVKAGLGQLSSPDWVIIHDGARPCVSPELLKRGLEEAQSCGAAIAAVPVVDTIKVIHEGFIVATLKRETLQLAQTPQVFRYDLIVEAYNEIGDDVTDDAALVEKLGYGVRVFPGSYENIKVTTPLDIILAEEILRRRYGNKDRYRL